MLTAGWNDPSATGLPIQAGALPGAERRSWIGVPLGHRQAQRALARAERLADKENRCRRRLRKKRSKRPVRGHVVQAARPLPPYQNHLIAGPIAFTILAFPLEVSRMRRIGRRGQRSRRWFTRAEALAAVQPVDLQILIGDFELNRVQRARRDGASVIALHTSPAMDVALALYLRMGFKLERRVPDRFGVPNAVYLLRLE